MKYTPQLAYSIGDHLSKRGIDSTRDTFSPIFDGLEGDDLVEAVGFLYSHGFSRSVIGSLFEDTPAATVLYALKKSKATPPDNVTGLDTTLNGVEVTAGQRVLLLPGGYELAYGSEHFAPTSTDPLLVGEQYGHVDWPDPELTEDGQTAFRGAVQEAVDACLTETTLAAGCGMTPVPETSNDGWTMV